MIAIALALLVLAMLPVSSDAQAAATRDSLAVTVSAGGGWVEFSFPRLAVADSGCADPLFRGKLPGSRRYEWLVVTTERGTDSPSHYYTVRSDVRFELPRDVSITDARIDSILASITPRMAELIGESHVYARSEHSSVHRDAARLRVRFEGGNVVPMLLSRDPDRALLYWCYRPDQELAARLRTVPITFSFAP
jgi:hypothetical protein